MTLRMRNRFKPRPTEGLTCFCGRYVTHAVEGGREMLIHQEPWCERFRELVERLQADAGAATELHVGLMDPLRNETMLVADGDSISDVRVKG